MLLSILYTFETDKSPFIYQIIPQSGIIEYKSAIERSKGVNGERTTFVGKHESLDQTKQRAILFIQSIITWQRDQIAGNSLELSTTTL